MATLYLYTQAINYSSMKCKPFLRLTFEIRAKKRLTFQMSYQLNFRLYN